MISPKQIGMKILATCSLIFLIGTMGLIAQTVRGTVTDALDRTTLPGVTVIIKGTTQGTTTDVNGNFQINAAPDDILVFSYLGMLTEEVQVGNQTVINVVMSKDIALLQEIVVIGYGAIQRRDVTGSVASVSGEALAAKPIFSVGEALTGKLAGVQVLTTEGSPDAEIMIRVRGGGSITGDNSPLFIVDGFPVQSISDIAPSEIESIDVLKDASSTAIYGSRGANGVIIITTKRARDERFTVRYDLFSSFKQLANRMDVLSPYDYTLWQYEHSLLDNNPERYASMFGNYQDMDLYQTIKGNDWQEQVFGRIGSTTNHNLSFSGGVERTSYAFNYSRIDDKAIMQMSGFRRDNLSLSLTNKPNDKLTLDFSLRFSNTRIEGGGTNEQVQFSTSADPRLRHAMLYPAFPVTGLTDAEETDPNFLLDHPLVSLADNDRFQQRLTYNLNASLTWDIIENLRFRTDIGLDDFRNTDERFYGQTTFYVRNRPAAEHQGLPAIMFANTARETYRTTNTLAYDFGNVVPENHRMNLLIGQEYIFRQMEELENIVHGFPAGFDFNTARRLSAQASANTVDNYLFPDDKLLSFFGRLNYDYLGRYLFSATFRADGSSKFSRGNRWGYFPSAAFAWRISDESFMEFARGWLTDMKIRLSYGTAGNNNIPPGQLAQTLEVRTTTWVSGFNSFWAGTKTMANPDLRWETTITRNVGIDYDLFGGQLNGSFEGYINQTDDLLIRFPTPGTGYTDQYRNMGKTENRGIEAMLTWNAINRPDFGLGITGNIGFNRNTILSLGAMDDFGAETGWASADIGVEYLIASGGSVGNMHGHRSAGRYEVADFEGFIEGAWVLKPGVTDSRPVVGPLRPGSKKLIDINGDGIVNRDDRVVIGDANPKHTGGITINARAHGFDLVAAFNWSYGNDIYNANKIEFTTARFHSRNMVDVMADGTRWTNLYNGEITNDPVLLEQLNQNTTMWSPDMARFVFSDWAVEDGSFIRLNTLTLGYNLPRNVVNRIRVESLRVYVSSSNVFLLTNYSGFDPEVSTRRATPLTPGVDYSAFPRSRSIVFGLNLSI